MVREVWQELLQASSSSRDWGCWLFRILNAYGSVANLSGRYSKMKTEPRWWKKNREKLKDRYMLYIQVTYTVSLNL